MSRIADFLEVGESTLKRWRKTPEGSFIAIGSISNVGGGGGCAAWTFASSAEALADVMEARTRAARQAVALRRWAPTAVNTP